MGEILHSDNNKERMKNYDTIFKNSRTKSKDLRIHVVEEEAEIQMKCIGNLFNEIIAENFPNLGKNKHPCTGGILNLE
jgi:hypothetical protein